MSVIKPINNQQLFILNEIFGMSWIASVQHNKVYKSNTRDVEKSEFQNYIEKYIEDKIISRYINTVSEKEHNNNITKIAKYAENRYSSILENDVYKIGTAQKLLNLLLKYYWCLGLI